MHGRFLERNVFDDDGHDYCYEGFDNADGHTDQPRSVSLQPGSGSVVYGSLLERNRLMIAMNDVTSD